MRDVTRRGFGCGALGALLAIGAPVRAQTSSQLERQRERLIVSLMCLRDGDLIADESATYGAFQQHREQVLTLDVGRGPEARTLLVTLWDRDAGGVLVNWTVLDARGGEQPGPEFTMYPFVEKAATRVEPVRFPVMRVSDSGNDQLIEMARLELHLTMKRVVRGR